MRIQALNNSYNQIINSDFIQTTIQSIQSLVYRIFINPSNLCLAGHILTMGFLSCLSINTGRIVQYSVLFELLFLTIQEARKLYHFIQNIIRSYQFIL